MGETFKTDTTIRACLLFISAVLLVYSLYALRDILAPLAMAIFIWLIIDAFARWIDNLSPRVPYSLALFLALMTVLGLLVGVVFVIADTATDMARDAPAYQARLNELFSLVNKILPEGNSVAELNTRFGIVDKLQGILFGLASTVQGILGNFLEIAVYVAFLFAAQSSFGQKMIDLFPESDKRSRASKVTESIRRSVEKYVGVQTVASLIQTVLSYIVMAGFGLENALFWAMVIFILNYIPIVGGILAVILPVLFALVQFESLQLFAFFTVALILVQAVFNNMVQPKMMGDSLNMSALVVILSLTLWGALWGGVGMFLSAPLTVIIMIILAQFPTTRWISILLSANGKPDAGEDKGEPKPSL